MTDQSTTENAAPGGPCAADCSTFHRLRLNSPIVARIMQSGGTAEDCAVALAEHNNRLIARLMMMEGIAPRRIKLPDGREMIWRCPEHLVAEINMSNAPLHLQGGATAEPCKSESDCSQGDGHA